MPWAAVGIRMIARRASFDSLLTIAPLAAADNPWADDTTRRRHFRKLGNNSGCGARHRFSCPTAPPCMLSVCPLSIGRLLRCTECGERDADFVVSGARR